MTREADDDLLEHIRTSHSSDGNDKEIMAGTLS